MRISETMLLVRVSAKSILQAVWGSIWTRSSWTLRTFGGVLLVATTAWVLVGLCASIHPGLRLLLVSGVALLLLALAAGLLLARQENRQLRQELSAERQQNEHDLQAIARHSEDQQEQLDAIWRLVNHDFQEPLRKLTSFSELLRRHMGTTLDEQAGRDLSYIVDGAVRMQALVQDLISYSRCSRARQIREEPVALQGAVQRACDGLFAQIRDTGAQVEVGELPVVYGEQPLLIQLWQNLLSNSLKFRRPDCTPRVRIRAEQLAGFWCFSVQDNGIGIDPKHAEHVFAAFKRIHSQSEFSGNGIGLCICRETVRRHGGWIWFESQPGEGTTFFFVLPRRGEGSEPA